MPRSAVFWTLLVVWGFARPSAAQPPFGDDPFAPQPAPSSKLPKEFTARADVTLTVSPAKAKWGETVVVKLTIAPKPGSWTYPVFPSQPGQTSTNLIELPEPGDVIFISRVADPPQQKWELKPRLGGREGEFDQVTFAPITWEFKAVVSPKAKAGPTTIAFTTSTLQVCDNAGCFPGTGRRLPTATLDIEEGASDRVHPDDLAAALEILRTGKMPPDTPPPNRPDNVSSPAPPGREPTEKSSLRKPAPPIETYTQQLEAIAQSLIAADEGDVLGSSKQAGLVSFIFTAAAWGFISLVTPCVFPMIPITVSIFLKQAHGSLRERLKLAAVYSLTIITVLGVSAFALLKFMAILSAHPVTNLLLATLFIILALSLFGMYELTLPGSLQRHLQAKQSRGGVIGTIFGALAFTVISFTCVAPFLGGFAGISAGSTDTTGLIVVPTAREIAGGLAFATAFATPFFVLALLPGLMRALPKSGGWLDSVKVVMGFLELAAALKFLRTAELRIFPTPQYFTYDVVLGAWVAISAACGLYLLNLFRLPHDEEQPHIGVPRLLFALFFLGLAIYLAPGLMRGPDGKPQRPAGAVYAWVEAFLLPEAIEEGWSTDLPETLAAARKSGKPVFVDFTGVTCTNCKYNESNIFPLPAVHEQLQKFERVQLYTDEVPAHAYASDPGQAARRAEARANGEFQIAAFQASQLPLYAVLMPQGDRVRVVGIYPEGKINNPDQFAAFLREALEKAKK